MAEYSYSYDESRSSIENVDASHAMDYNGSRARMRELRSVDHLRKVPRGSYINGKAASPESIESIRSDRGMSPGDNRGARF